MVNIKSDNKIGAEVITTIDNNENICNKLIDQHLWLISFTFATFAIINYTENLNLIILEKTPLIPVNFNPNKFFFTFAIFTNKTFARKAKMCKSNLF